MPRCLFNFLALILTLHFGWSVSFAQQTKGGKTHSSPKAVKEGKTYALIVGISEYQHKETYQSLRYADDDARAFYNFLKSPDGGSVPDTQIDTLFNEAATQVAFVSSLKTISEQLDTNDIFYIYFSGHGDALRYDRAFLLAYDAPSAKGAKEKNHYWFGFGLIDIDNLKSILAQIQENRQAKAILITDACRTDELPGGNALSSDAYEFAFEKNKGEIQLISCSSNQVSFEGPQWGGGRGLFSFHLINGLRGLADTEPPDNKVTLAELYDYTKRQVNRASYDSINSTYLQTPKYCCSGKDGMVMSRAASPDGYAPVVVKSDITSSPIFASNKGVNLAYQMTVLGLDSAWQKYVEMVNQGKLIGGKSAKIAYDELMSSPKIDDLSARLLKIHFCSALLGSVSEVVNIYLTAAQNNNLYTPEFFATAYQELKLYTELTDKRYYDTTTMRVNSWFFDAHSFWQSNKAYELRNALAKLDSAVVLRPDAAYLYNIKGLLEQKLYLFRKANATFSKAIDLAPNWIYPLHNYGQNFAYLGNLDSAEFYLRKTIALDTNYQTSYNGMALIKSWKDQKDSAFYFGRKGLEKDPKDPWLWQLLGELHTEQSNYDSASYCLYKSIQYDNTAIRTYSDLLNVLIATNASSDSLSKYINLIAYVDTSDPTGWIILGDVFKKYDYDSTAFQYYGMAVYYDSLNADANFLLAQSYQDMEQYEYALYYYLKVVELEPERPRAPNQIAIMYYSVGLPKEAIPYMQDAVIRQPNDPILFNNLGFILVEAALYQEAIDPLKNAIKLNPLNASPHYELARAYAYLKEKKLALSELQKCVNLDPNQSQYTFQSEEAFSKLKKKRKFKKIINALAYE
jgi:tetratricopeptide (TPR) repeat protein